MGMVNFGKRILILGPEVEAEVAKVVDYCSHPGHWYYPTEEDSKADVEGRPSANIDRPNKRAEHNIMLGSYYCTFSITVMKEGRFKHLTIRTPDAPPDTAPDPTMCVEIGKLFKLDPDPKNWQLDLDQCKPACCIIVEPIEWHDQGIRERWNAAHPNKPV